MCPPPLMVLFVILVRLAHKRNCLNSLNLPSHGGPILSIRSDITCENSPYRFSDKQCHDSGQNFWSYHQFGWERVVHPEMLFSVFSPLGFRNNKILDKIGPYFISQYWQNALQIWQMLIIWIDMLQNFKANHFLNNSSWII